MVRGVPGSARSAAVARTRGAAPLAAALRAAGQAGPAQVGRGCGGRPPRVSRPAGEAAAASSSQRQQACACLDGPHIVVMLCGAAVAHAQLVLAHLRGEAGGRRQAAQERLRPSDGERGGSGAGATAVAPARWRARRRAAPAASNARARPAVVQQPRRAQGHSSAPLKTPGSRCWCSARMAAAPWSPVTSP